MVTAGKFPLQPKGAFVILYLKKIDLDPDNVQSCHSISS